MTKSALLSAVSTITAVCILTGCGQSATNSSSEVSTTQVAAPAPGQNNLAQPAGNIMDQPDAGVNYDQPGDRNVTVNAPFSATKVDRDTGSVHIDAPFVHIDKAGRGQKMHIDVGGDSGASNSR
jgi:hypothetical protein